MPPPLLLLQVRTADDAMGGHEQSCFARHLDVDEDALVTWNLLDGAPKPGMLESAGGVLIGGSGDFSVVRGGPWLSAAMETMRRLVDLSLPTFASCWGFQAMSAALGGTVQHLPERGHVGTFDVQTTKDAVNDPLFSSLGPSFAAQFGHEDVVTTAPERATVLVQSADGDCLAWRLGQSPIWGTQFHPELSVDDLALRLRRYPQYVRDVRNMEWDDFQVQCLAPSPKADTLLRAFRNQLGT
jgi:GMP synthase (glutamine-hydrolysing)